MNVGEQRVDGHLAPLKELRELLERHPDESVRVTSIYESRGWWRVTVAIGLVEAFSPRFKAWDDATSFRLAAIELASTEGEQ